MLHLKNYCAKIEHFTYIMEEHFFSHGKNLTLFKIDHILIYFEFTVVTLIL